MKIGAMTSPFRDLLPQIDWIGRNDFDYVDLAVEPPLGEVADIDAAALARSLERNGLEVVVHTSPYLPFASRHREVREASLEAALQSVRLARELGARLLTVHHLGAPPYYQTTAVVETYARLLEALIDRAGSIPVAIENGLGNREEVALFRSIFERVPEARLLLDVAHAHIGAEKSTAAFLADPVVGERLCHVHVSDNNGVADLHLPLGAVRRGIDWPQMVRLLRRHGYDGTVTLEVFSPDPDYLLLSRDKLRRWWSEAEPDAKESPASRS